MLNSVGDMFYPCPSPFPYAESLAEIPYPSYFTVQFCTEQGFVITNTTLQNHMRLHYEGYSLSNQ